MVTGIPYIMTDLDRRFLAGGLGKLQDVNLMQFQAAKRRALEFMMRMGYPDTDNFLHYFLIQFAINPSFDFPNYLTFMENLDNPQKLREWGVVV